MCVCKVQFSSWHKPGHFFEHAVRLYTIPLVLYNLLSVVMLSVWVFNYVVCLMAVCDVKQVVYSTELQELCCSYGPSVLRYTVCNNV